MDYTIRIGGEAGQGIQTVGPSLARYLARCGYHLWSHQDYESRVRGGHNYYQIRFADKPVFCSTDTIDILVAMDAASLQRHLGEMALEGVVIYDSAGIKTTCEDSRCINIPFNEIAKTEGGDRIMATMASVGAVLGLLKLELGPLERILDEELGRKGSEVVQNNLKVARAAHAAAGKACERCAFELAPKADPRMLMEGAASLGLGAIASGLKFYAGYPMTPSTPIMEYVSSKSEEYGILVEQAEDEICAINMIQGASYAGVRSMTSSAGGGFALMIEGLSLAAMTETPVVIAVGGRPAPATGLPTRTEQGDLLFVTFAGHGEFPRVVFAPGNHEQAFFLTNKAFDLAEKYQIPCIILYDQYFADALWTPEPFDLSRLRYQDYRLRGAELAGTTGYKRHAFTESGVSPLAIPGASPNLVFTDSDEHDEDGHIIEDAETRKKMVQKRYFRKLPLIREEIAGPEYYGPDDPDIILTGWGTNWGIMREAVDALSGDVKLGMLHFSELYPFPSSETSDYLERLAKARQTICVENNARGQFAMLLQMETGFRVNDLICRYDGRPFTKESFLEEINAHT